MSMMNEIEKLMQSVGTSFNYRVVNLGGESVYVDGIKSVVSLLDTEMIFQLKNCILYVVGDEMKLKYLDKTSCVIVGKIRLVEIK